ncbi:MAG: hypothetical protein EOM37_00810 [Proteobacteria bacterium]|jgi:hypothetical protein|nr:hypothetical protein [Alphaproteobacteria bacterium]NCC02580.1 hypothetical protein [Pseudomonadota bacterium]
MKRLTFLALALATLSSVPAQAAELSFSSPNSAPVNMNLNGGALTAGYEGDISTVTSAPNGNSYAILDEANLNLAANTKIVFTYTLSSGQAALTTAYDFTFVPADIKPELTGFLGSTIFTLALSNLTGQATSFSSIALRLKGITDTTAITTRYTTTSLASAVPLPAALPLFGAGLVGLLGYKRSKKNEA